MLAWPLQESEICRYPTNMCIGHWSMVHLGQLLSTSHRCTTLLVCKKWTTNRKYATATCVLNHGFKVLNMISRGFVKIRVWYAPLLGDARSRNGDSPAPKVAQPQHRNKSFAWHNQSDSQIVCYMSLLFMRFFNCLQLSSPLKPFPVSSNQEN